MNILIKKALTGAFFCACLLLNQCLIAELNSLCPTSQPAKEVIVHHITDGDTLTLNSGDRVRILGINTAEINFKDPKQSQALAIAARESLQQMLPDGTKVQLLFDEKKRDRYKRLLAFVRFTDKQSNVLDVGEELLKKGLAWQYLILPNQLCWQRYRKAEDEAFNNQRGVWDNTVYPILKAKDVQLQDKKQQYLRVKGRITAIEHSTKNDWFVIDNVIWLGISKKDKSNFSSQFQSLKIDARILVSGWTYHSYGKLRIKVRHPQAIRFILD